MNIKKILWGGGIILLVGFCLRDVWAGECAATGGSTTCYNIDPNEPYCVCPGDPPLSTCGNASDPTTWEGFCIPLCEDTDGGINITTKGECRHKNMMSPGWTAWQPDSCGGAFLFEVFCKTNPNYPYAQWCYSNAVTCPVEAPDCVDGACVPEFPPYTPAVFTIFPAIGYYVRRVLRKCRRL